MMPISSVQFRAEIGLFYNTFYCSRFFNNRFSVNFFAGLNSRLLPSPIHMLTFIILLIVFPLISFFAVIFGQTRLYRIFRLSYVYIYFCMLLARKLQLTVTRRCVMNLVIQYYFFLQVCLFLPYMKLYLIICGDVEINPGPISMHDLSVCHWNLNGICTNDFVKVSLLEAYTAVHDFDVICLSETFLNSESSSDDERLELQGYAPMIRSDHPSDEKRGGVCMFFKENLPFVRRDDLECDECIVGEIRVKQSKCFITCFYRSPSQSCDEIEVFLSNFEQVCSSIALESPKCSIILGDFNAKSTTWWPEGEDNYCGTELYSISNILGYSQLINKPTHFRPNKAPSCIDLIFACQPNLVTESGVHSSLCNTCHHQITFAKISFKVFLPPSYEREI